jgi:hypothetical protein
MTYSLSGAALSGFRNTGARGLPRRHHFRLAEQFGSVHAAASALGFNSVKALQNSLRILRAVGNAYRANFSDLIESRRAVATSPSPQTTIYNSPQLLDFGGLETLRNGFSYNAGQAKHGCDRWNSRQSLSVANVSSLLSRERTSVSFVSKFLAWRGTTSSTEDPVAGTAGKLTCRNASDVVH